MSNLQKIVVLCVIAAVSVSGFFLLKNLRSTENISQPQDTEVILQTPPTDNNIKPSASDLTDDSKTPPTIPNPPKPGTPPTSTTAPGQPTTTIGTGDSCGTYTLNGEATIYCATCGNEICEERETCTSSGCWETNGKTACTEDCGPLYCPTDCQ